MQILRIKRKGIIANGNASVANAIKELVHVK